MVIFERVRLSHRRCVQIWESLSFVHRRVLEKMVGESTKARAKALEAYRQHSKAAICCPGILWAVGQPFRASKSHCILPANFHQ